jgi:(p)ppGpp synthase/HD superfamily hydrolase
MTASPPITERYARTLTYSAGIHSASHLYGAADIRDLLAVSALVLQAGGDEDQAIAALLHDSVERCGGKQRLDDIRERFGDRVALIVEGCSDWVDQPWQMALDGGRHTQSKLDNLALADEPVMLVRLAVIAEQAQRHSVRRRIGADLEPDLVHYFAACLYVGQQRRAPQVVITPLALAVHSMNGSLP